MIDDVEYIRKDSVENYKEATQLDGMDYVVIRGDRSGVFAGYLQGRDKQEVTLRNVRRLWYWDGACSISQLAVDGTAEPDNCKFTIPLDTLYLTDVIEVIPATEKARKSIQGVAEWKK